MIMWEAAPDGYLECVGNDWYGVVGLTPARTGWMARLEGPGGRHIASVLFGTAREAKRWVEHRIDASEAERPTH